MVAIKNVLLFVTLAASLVIEQRDTNTILKDVSTIDTDVKALTSAINKYNGGIINAVPIQNAESTLEKAIKQGTTDAKATSKLSSADSKKVIAAIDNLRPDIQATLSALKSKKAQFAKDGLTSTVKSDLNALKTETDDFANALIAIASSDTTTTAKGEKTTIDGYFTDAINFYNA